MANNNNNLSSFILLIIIAVAIYYLFNSECFNSVNFHENFSDSLPANFSGNQQFNLTNTQAPVMQNDSSVIQNDLSHENIQSNQLQTSEQSHYTTIDEPNVPLSVIDDIVNNFQPNDDLDYEVGTNLNDAFASPIPQGMTTDTIDFKKQNVDDFNAKDFLPREINDEWFETDFSLAKYQLNDDKLINTEKYIIGINTVGESLKNASWDIRGTVPCPKIVVSPWNNSTYEPDFNLKPLC